MRIAGREVEEEEVFRCDEEKIDNKSGLSIVGKQYSFVCSCLF